MLGEAMIRFTCETLTKRFGHFTAVDHDSFAVAKGSIFGCLNNPVVTLRATPTTNWPFLG